MHVTKRSAGKRFAELRPLLGKDVAITIRELPKGSLDAASKPIVEVDPPDSRPGDLP